MSTIPVDDRCRKFADFIVNHYIDFTTDLRGSSPQQGPTITNAAKSFHSHMNADIRTPHPNMCVFVQSLIRQHSRNDRFTGIHASTQSESSATPTDFQTIRAASLTSSATLGALDIALHLSVFLLRSLLRLTLTMLRFWSYKLRFRWFYVCAFVENTFAFSWQFLRFHSRPTTRSRDM